MNLTIEKVYPKAREWTGQYGPSAAVKVLFLDGSEGDYLTKPDKAEGIIAQLSELVGKEGDFEVEERPDYNGVKQWKIKAWPGKPQGGAQGGGGGGGRQYTPRYTDTAEGFAAEQRAMNARTAVMQAIAFCTGKQNDVPLQEAGMIFDWLQARTFPDAPKTAEPVQTRSNGQNASQQASDVPTPPSEEEAEHHADPRKRFFALWRDLNLPDSQQYPDYMRFVLQRILVKVKAWPEDVPIESRTELGEALWGIAAGDLKSYSSMLVRKGIKPMQEEGFQQEEAEV